MRYLSVKNFKKHQHYTNRRPPWIKLHVEVLDDYAFSCLQDASKAHLMLLWVLASKLDNRIPYDLPYLAKKLGTTTPIDVEELILQGFVECSQDDSTPLASRKQAAIAEGERETEGETETETETEGEAERVAPPPRKRTAAPATETETAVRSAWEQHVGEIPLATLRRALGPAIARHGSSAVCNAIPEYAEARRASGKPARPEWFAQEIALYIPRRAVDPETGLLNDVGMAVLNGSRS